ncbi:hypothetical protein GCM10027160_28440 [Streptomyces calidiresistens]
MAEVRELWAPGAERGARAGRAERGPAGRGRAGGTGWIGWIGKVGGIREAGTGRGPSGVPGPAGRWGPVPPGRVPPGRHVAPATPVSRRAR